MSGGYDAKGPIFISYRQSDGKPYAELLDNYLRAGGLVPWRDLVDLPPGETKQRVEEAFEEGISNAVLVVTNDLADSEFVPKVELPALLGLDATRGTSNRFHLLILNTREKPDQVGDIDVAAPDRLLKTKGHWPPPNCGKDAPLSDLKQYALLPTRGELRQLYADLLDARLRARVKIPEEGRAKKVVIHAQTRPAGTAHSRLSGVNSGEYSTAHEEDAYDLIVRLRQDPETGVPSELAMVSLQQTLPLLVDGLYAHGVAEVELRAAGHAVLPWALGAALPTTRMGLSSMIAIDIHNQPWGRRLPRATADWLPCPHEDCDGKVSPDVVPDEAKAEDRPPCDRHLFHAEFSPEFAELMAKDVPQDYATRVLVLLQVEKRANLRAFRRLAEGIEDLQGTFIVSLRGPEECNGKVPSDEGVRLANEITNALRDLVNKTGIDEIHIANQLPVALSALLGRLSNTLNIVLYEWGADGRDGNREYVRMARIQPGMPGGPITEVFPRRRPRHTGEITEFVNLTPHAMNLIREGVCVHSWPAAGEDEWCRLTEKVEDVDPLAHGDIEVPVALVTEGDVANHPPSVPGRGYIVPRLTATGSNRDDFFFPIRQTRDKEGRIAGAEGLAQYSGHDLSTSQLLKLLTTDCPQCRRVLAEAASSDPHIGLEA